ncbi:MULTISPECIES: glycoside hydrolase family 3 N-terminal domain-containing protein [Microbacterium]|jgi:beta-N-acetylhexosaminidase|uniref:glycoside hydrolase family 3 N-terminal domain-containing protein n=1 Tax=Microbacterium TaxID=33882 RepID=UPI001D17AF63|nr:glycoside hydrolase family 3 N-terminal domain-containing protein [Microbacterium testaceum]MCC4249638.1 glycoside hydrolase family 3 protein [Microbacterium testaceum]
MTNPTRSATLLVLVALALSGCVPEPAPAPTETPTPTPTRTATPTPTPTPDPLAGLSLEDKVGQMFMVGTSVDGADATTLAAVRDDRIGGIFLHGRSDAGTEATAALVGGFTSVVAAGQPELWVATDQEGGTVQVLSGPGFDRIPSAVDQGRQDDGTLRGNAATWGRQLAQAGVNMNLAPVADVVTSPDTAQSNPPIGELAREYGYDGATVAAKAGAFAQGMRDGGILPTFKHFPGLGHVGENTDTNSGVTDVVVTADGPDVAVYSRVLPQGPAVVMLSTAIYAEIDPTSPAAFSPTVVGVLRDTVGFDGVVTTDDLSAARQVQPWSPADRATLAVDAGIDLLLVSADSSVYPAMRQAVLAKAQGDPVFAAKVDAAARRIITAKAAMP